MEIRSPRDIGREAKSTRTFLRLKQSDVARACGVSRQWLSDLEKGKTTLELGLVLRAFEQLGIDLTARRADDPPRWTRSLTIEAEMREWRSMTRRQRKRLEMRARERATGSGNLQPD